MYSSCKGCQSVFKKLESMLHHEGDGVLNNWDVQARSTQKEEMGKVHARCLMEAKASDYGFLFQTVNANFIVKLTI
jgi:hypothetical protein